MAGDAAGTVTPGMDATVDALAAFLARHPRLFVLTGAGCSTDSGIPDYRDGDGDRYADRNRDGHTDPDNHAHDRTRRRLSFRHLGSRRWIN